MLSEREIYLTSQILRVETKSSIWLITNKAYQRMPRDEKPRKSIVSIQGRLDDGIWHEYSRFWLRVYHDNMRCLRILPKVGPPGGRGITTGLIVSIQGDWKYVNDDDIVAIEVDAWP